MNGESTDPLQGRASASPVLGPAISPRSAARPSTLGSLPDPVAPFAPRAEEAARLEEPAAGNASAGEPAAEDLPWLTLDPADAGAAQEPTAQAEPAVERGAPEPAAASAEAGAPAIAAEHELDPWELPPSTAPAYEEPTPIGELVREPATTAPASDRRIEEGVDTTAEWLFGRTLESDAAAWAEAPLLPELPAVPPAATEPDAEAAAAAALEPPAQAAPSPGASGVLAEVADRLEQIARSMRQRSPAELFGGGGEADPLQMLITGYALGYSEALRATRSGPAADS